MSDSVSVQVALRVRPLVESEISRGCQLSLECVPNEPQVVVKGTDKAFTFNYVFGPDDDNKYLYKTAVKDLVSHVFKGYNVTILAYGQTGSGKTFSMGTSYSEGENFGVIPLAVNDIFETVEEMKDREFKIRVSFMELYQEQLFDLLDTYKSVVDIREDIRGIIVPRLTEVAVCSSDETTKCLTRGSSGRCTGATAMNAQSSRSHAIFTITVSQQFKTNENNSTTSKFHLVDLAGSERSKKTKATGERFKEGININRGLFALGNVISALGDECQKGYISYRDSKLTRLLQDSLGGNSLTLMIACVSPADYNLDETLSTLRYADRARRIRNKPVVNQDPTAALIAKLKQELHEAQTEILNTKRNCPEEHLLLQNENIHILNENIQLEKLKLKASVAMTSLKETVYRSESANNHCLMKLQEIQAEFDNTMHNLNELVNSKPCSPNITEELKCLNDLQQTIQFSQETQSSVADILDKEYTTDNAYLLNDFPTSPYTLSRNILPQIDTNERESHILQHIVLSKELIDQSKSLLLKEKLAAQLVLNSDQILNLNTDYENTVRNLESQVQALQKEKEELEHTLEEIKNSAVNQDENEKTYTEKVSSLQGKISVLNKKIEDQNEMIKMHGKAERKICHLNSEITSMKESKLKLIKQMKTESDQFKNWNIKCEREISKLLDKDRRSQTQLVHMERSYAKEQGSWKKKLEEATVVKRRLRDALAMQDSAQERHEDVSSSTKVHTRILQELELMYRVMDAEKTLDELVEDRNLLNEKLEVFSVDLASGKISEDNKNEIQQEMDQLTESILARNTQIADLHQKIIDCDLENKNKTRWDYIQSLSVSKYALKHLFNIALQMKRGKANSEERLEELAMKVQTKENAIRDYEINIKEQMVKSQQEIICLEKKQEEKVFILLKHLSGAADAPTYNEVVEQVFNRQRRIEELVAMVIQDAQKDHPSDQTDAQNNDLTAAECVTDENQIGDDGIKEPAWQTTPVYKRIQSLIKMRKSEDSEEKEKAVKRTLDGNSKCRCRSKTRTLNLSKMGSLCSPACKWNSNESPGRERDLNGNCESVAEENVLDNVKKPRNLNLGDSSSQPTAVPDVQPLLDEVTDADRQQDSDTQDAD